MRTKIDQKTAARELRKLCDRSGRITPDKVVEAARDESHPLHDYFEWNDTKAGHNWRVDQARDLIAWVKTEYKIEERVINVSAFVRDPTIMAGHQGYRSTEAVRRSKEDAREVIVEEFHRAGAHLRRARDLARVLGKVEEVEPLVDRLEELRVAFAGHA